MRRLIPPLALLAASPSTAQLVTTVPPPVPVPVLPAAADGRLFGHLPYSTVDEAFLVPISDAVAPGKSCRLHRDVAADLDRLVSAAQAEGIRLRALSCFRGATHQRTIFCGAGLVGQCRDPADRARSVAPGGYSEHATGYVLDFGADGPAGCNDLDPCMSGTPGGMWLARNAIRFGFEQSFPPGNRQGVTWEPWHWRWVGATATAFGATAARAVFARARGAYPALPGIADAPVVIRLTPVDPARFVGPRP